MKRNGFTLVELLAVIAILGILIIIVLPNVLSSLKESKQKLFVTNYQTLFKSVEGYIMTEQLNNPNNTTTKEFTNYCFENNELDGYATDSKYYISIYEGKIVTLNIINKDYAIIKIGEDIKVEDISTDDLVEYDEGINICPVMSM